MRRIGLVAVVAGALLLAACTSSVISLDVGTCFDDPPDLAEVAPGDVPIVDCDTPHDNEVFATQNLTGDEFPGVDGVSNRADQVCLGTFDAYVGEPYESSIYQFSWLVPSADTWEVGDREVICFAFDMNFEKITGSLNGIGQ